MNVLFTSVGRRSYLVKYFKEAIGENGKVFAANSSSQSPAFLAADEHVVTPFIYDRNYIPFLLNYCRENQITALIPLFDVDLPVLARSKAAFAAIGTNVIVSDSDFIEVCNDKWKTFRFLQENGFCVPLTFLSLEDAKQAISTGAIHYPVMVKPRWGMGSISVYQADNEAELTVLYHKVRRGIEDSYLKYESAADMDTSVLIQEKIKGQEYGLDVMNDLKGCYCNTSAKKKVAMRSGETDCAVTVDNDALKELGKKISLRSHHIGNLDVDVFLTEGNVPCVLEMNARFGGGYPFSHIAGVNLPKAIVQWLEGKQAEPQLLEPAAGVVGQKDIELVVLEGCQGGR